MKILKKDMTQAILKDYFDYDSTTGHLTWKVKYCSKVIVGNRAGGIATTHKHRVIRFMGALYPEHRLIWLWYYGSVPSNHIDHINHDEQDNRICNLRSVSQATNNMNNSLRKDNKLGVAGVHINKQNKYKKYEAELHLNGRRLFCKCFYTLQEAIDAREAQKVLHGFHKNHGMPKPL